MASKNNKVLKGRLKRWNEAKGFGFISSENEERDIFIHISDLKGMSRRPIVGDIIHYQVMVQDDGKNRAIKAKIEGVKPIKSKSSAKDSVSLSKNQLITAAFVIVVLALSVSFLL